MKSDKEKSKIESNIAPWKKPKFVTDEEWGVMPHTQEEFDALPTMLSCALGAKYHMDKDDVSGLWVSMMYLAWAYHTIHMAELPFNGVEGVKAADDAGYDRKNIELMAEMFRRHFAAVHGDVEANGSDWVKNKIRKIKDMYGYDIKDGRK